MARSIFDIFGAGDEIPLPVNVGATDWCRIFAVKQVCLSNEHAWLFFSVVHEGQYRQAARVWEDMGSPDLAGVRIEYKFGCQGLNCNYFDMSNGRSLVDLVLDSVMLHRNTWSNQQRPPEVHYFGDVASDDEVRHFIVCLQRAGCRLSEDFCTFWPQQLKRLSAFSGVLDLDGVDLIGFGRSHLGFDSIFEEEHSNLNPIGMYNHESRMQESLHFYKTMILAGGQFYPFSLGTDVWGSNDSSRGQRTILRFFLLLGEQLPFGDTGDDDSFMDTNWGVEARICFREGLERAVAEREKATRWLRRRLVVLCCARARAPPRLKLRAKTPRLVWDAGRVSAGIGPLARGLACVDDAVFKCIVQFL